MGTRPGRSCRATTLRGWPSSTGSCPGSTVSISAAASGHMAGDAVLRETAHRAGRVIRGYDVLGRYGGEEFVLVCPGCDAAGVGFLAERIRDGLASEPVNTSEGVIPITLIIETATT